MEPTIRCAGIQDYEVMSPIFAEVDVFHADALPRYFRPLHGPARSREYLEEVLADPNAAVLVAELGDEVAGLVMVVARTAPPYPMFVPRTWAVIDFVGVRSVYRRQGIGRALVEAAHAWARQRGIMDVELTVWEFNEGARAFYEALGYRTITRHMACSIKWAALP